MPWNSFVWRQRKRSIEECRLVLHELLLHPIEVSQQTRGERLPVMQSIPHLAPRVEALLQGLLNIRMPPRRVDLVSLGYVGYFQHRDRFHLPQLDQMMSKTMPLAFSGI